MDITKWDPINQLARFRDEMNRIFDNTILPYGGQLAQRWGWAPSVDVRETETHVIVTADIPGVDPDELDINLSADQLVLSGEIRRQTNVDERGYKRIERHYGSFQRVIPLPAEVKPQEATADYKHGVLEVTIPKTEAGQRRTVKVKVNKRDTDVH